MKKGLSRLLAILLALCMALALLPAAALAAEAEFTIENGVLTAYNGPGGKVVIPNGVTAINSGAFMGNRKITSVVVPEGVLRIGYDGVTYHEETLSDGTKWMVEDAGVHPSAARSYAFANCSNLVEVTLPSTLIIIDLYAFSGCSKLETVNFPKEGMLRTIHTGAFEGCTSLKSIAFPSYKLSHLVSVPFVIGGFTRCTALETVALPDADGLCDIGGGAFNNCPKLTTITNGESIYRISRDAFSGCTSLRNLTVSDTLDSVSLAVLAEAPWYKDRFSGEFAVSNGVLAAYNGPGGDVVIPGDLGITTIGDCDFASKNLTSVVIPEGVTAINGGAFSNCTALKSVTLPSSLRYIGGSASYGGSAFYGCTALTEISIPEGVTAIGESAFTGCSNLAKVTLPDTAVVCARAGSYPFSGSPYAAALLESQKDSEYVMMGATILKYQGSGGALVLPSKTRAVADNLFAGNDRITSITWPAEAQAWLRERYDSAVNSGESFIYFDAYPLSTDFEGCTRLTELVNWPSVDGNHERAVNNLRLFNLWVDPEDCLGVPGGRVAAQSNAVVSAAGAVTDYEKARALADWVAKNIKYDWDVAQGTKDSRDAVYDDLDKILDGAPTICDGYTKLYNALLWAQGIPANYVAGLAYKGSNVGVSHAWTEAYIDGRWVIVDTTWMAPFMNDTSEQGYDDAYFDPGIVYFSANHEIQQRSNVSEEDTPDDWAKAEVQAALDAGLVPEELQSLYRTNITRQEFCHLMIALVEKVTGQTAAVPSVNPFTDANDPAVLAAYSLGIVQGMTDTTFEPAGEITRQQAATMLARTAKTLGLTPGTGETFVDAGDVADWAAEGVSFVSSLADPTTGNKVMGGTGDGYFSPLQTYTRQQAILTALRLFHVK